MNGTGESGLPEIGVKLIDRDHNYIVELFSELQFHTVAGMAGGKTGAMLRQLAQLTQVHFLLEEGIMSATNYPGIAVHQLRHQWILEQNKALATQRGRKALERNSELLRYLADINDEHIRNDDLHYGLWLGTKAPRCAPAARNAMR